MRKAKFEHRNLESVYQN